MLQQLSIFESPRDDYVTKETHSHTIAVRIGMNRAIAFVVVSSENLTEWTLTDSRISHESRNGKRARKERRTTTATSTSLPVSCSSYTSCSWRYFPRDTATDTTCQIYPSSRQQESLFSKNRRSSFHRKTRDSTTQMQWKTRTSLYEWGKMDPVSSYSVFPFHNTFFVHKNFQAPSLVLKWESKKNEGAKNCLTQQEDKMWRTIEEDLFFELLFLSSWVTVRVFERFCSSSLGDTSLLRVDFPFSGRVKG